MFGFGWLGLSLPSGEFTCALSERDWVRGDLKADLRCRLFDQFSSVLKQVHLTYFTNFQPQTAFPVCIF